MTRSDLAQAQAQALVLSPESPLFRVCDAILVIGLYRGPCCHGGRLLPFLLQICKLKLRRKMLQWNDRRYSLHWRFFWEKWPLRLQPTLSSLPCLLHDNTSPSPSPEIFNCTYQYLVGIDLALQCEGHHIGREPMSFETATSTRRLGVTVGACMDWDYYYRSRFPCKFRDRRCHPSVIT